MSLLRSSATIASLTMLSRIFGFIRDVLIANTLGAGLLSDAFFVAFKLPNFLRRLFAEGAFNAAFLPQFAGLLKVKDQARAVQFASIIMAMLILILCCITAAALIFMPQLISLIAPGFEAGSQQFSLTVTLTRITFIYILCISLVSLLGGMLNSLDKFAATAATPILLNISLIAAILFLPPYVPNAAFALSIGVAGAGAVQLLWLYCAARRAGITPRLVRPRHTKDTRAMIKAFIPAAFGAGIAQINQLIDVILATTIVNAVSYLYYADRLYSLPLGVIGVAVATALLPRLSRHWRAGEHAEATQAMEQSLRITLLIGLPAGAALIILADPIIATIYQHGAFTDTDKMAVTPALIAYSCGLPAFLLIKLLSTVYFANQNTKTPMKIAACCMVLNLTLNLAFITTYAHVGLAMATSIAGWVNALLLGAGLWREGLYRPSRSLIVSSVNITLCCVIMCSALYSLMPFVQHWFNGSTLTKSLGMAALIAIGVASYGVSILLLRVVAVNDVNIMLRK